MSDDTFVILLIAIGTSALVDILLVRQIRRLQRRVGVNSEALRLLAEPIGVRLPSEVPARPQLKVIKGGMALLLLLLATLSAWPGRHLRAVTAAAGVGAAVTAGVLLSVHGSAAPYRGTRLPPVFPMSHSAYPSPSAAAPSPSAAPPSASASTTPAVPGSVAAVVAVHSRSAQPAPSGSTGAQGPGGGSAPGTGSTASPVCVLHVTAIGVLDICV